MYEKVPSGEMVVLLVKVLVSRVLVPSSFQLPGICLVNSASCRLQAVSNKLNARIMGVFFISVSCRLDVQSSGTRDQPA